MADPRSYLPPFVSESMINALLESLSIPLPISITLMSTSAAYHIIYVLSYTATITSFIPKLLSTSSSTSLILRIAGLHFPSIKTRNECAILKWLSSHTQIPVPEVLYYDATQNNELGYEYMIMSMVSGRSFEVLRKELLAPQYEEHLEGLLDQIVNVVSQLGSHSWQHIGGLQEMITSSKDDGSGSMLVPGPVVDESMWQVPELDLFWAGGETFQSLNIGGPFPSYTSFLTAQAEKFISAIEHHEALTHMRELIPRIKALMAVMDESEEELNKTRLVLAHRDLHFGNIMYDVPTKRITAVLDWEFACVVPAPRWDPHKAFLWNGVDNQEKLGLKERVVKKCYERGIRFFEDVEYTGQKQKHVQLAMNFLRAIVEVVPRGTIDKPVEDWTREMLKHMEALHII